jgi:hypothetical protein
MLKNRIEPGSCVFIRLVEKKIKNTLMYTLSKKIFYIYY